MEFETTIPFEVRSILPIDPRTKIFLTITVTTIMCTGGTGGMMNIIRPSVALFPILMLFLSKRKEKAAVFLLTYGVLFLLETFLFPVLKGAMSFLFGAVVGVYTHVLPGAIMGYYLIDTTNVSEFVAAMERMHASEKIIIPMSVVFRFFPTVIEEYKAISDAMRMRGITTLRSPLKMLEYRIVPLMISITKIGEELSAAALTRGLGTPARRTNICKVGFGWLDMVLFLFSILCWIGFLFQ